MPSQSRYPNPRTAGTVSRSASRTPRTRCDQVLEHTPAHVVGSRIAESAHITSVEVLHAPCADLCPPGDPRVHRRGDDARCGGRPGQRATSRFAMAALPWLLAARGRGRRLTPNGRPSPLDDAECRGWRSVAWSRTGFRLFSLAQLTCTDGPTQRMSGLSTILPDGSWLEVSSVEREGVESVRALHYTRVRGTSVPIDPFSFDEIVEASRRVQPSVLEAVLVHSGTGFALERRDLLALVKAGVPGRVLDAMVALSFPSRFLVHGPNSYSRRSVSPVDRGPVWTTDQMQEWTHAYSPWDFDYWGRRDPTHHGWLRHRPSEWEPRTPRRDAHRADPTPPRAYTPQPSVPEWKVFRPTGDRPPEVPATSSSDHAVTKQGYTRTPPPADDSAVFTPSPPARHDPPTAPEPTPPPVVPQTSVERAVETPAHASPEHEVTKQGYTRTPSAPPAPPAESARETAKPKEAEESSTASGSSPSGHAVTKKGYTRAC